MADKLAILTTLSSAPTMGDNQLSMPPAAPQVTIDGQQGGNIRSHAAQAVDYDRQGSRSRVTGACMPIQALPADRIPTGMRRHFRRLV